MRRRPEPVRNRFHRLLAIAAAGVLALLLGLMSVQVLARNFWNTGLPALDELTRSLLLYITLFGAALATLSGKHIRIDLASALTPRWAARLAPLWHLVAAMVSVVLAWAAWRYWQVEWRFRAGGLVWLDLILPIGFGLLAVAHLLMLRQKPAAVSEHRRAAKFTRG